MIIASKVKEKNNDNIQELTHWDQKETRLISYALYSGILGKEMKLDQNTESIKSTIEEEI